MKAILFFAAIAVAGTVFAASSPELSVDQQLILACYRLKVADVELAIKRGANVNARFGDENLSIFGDRREFEVRGAKYWTPLLALTHSFPSRLETTIAARNSEMDKKESQAVAILRLLINSQCNLDLDDGICAKTALIDAIQHRKVRLALFLIESNANVNCRTTSFFDGTYNVTPLHAGYWSPEITKALLAKGADIDVKDSEGRTPVELVRMLNKVSVLKVYEQHKSNNRKSP